MAYPRRDVPEKIPEQARLHMVYTHTDFINTYNAPSSIKPAFYYAGIPCQTRTYEITGVDWQPGDPHLDATAFDETLDDSIQVDTGSFLPYDALDDPPETSIQRRIIEWTRSYFRTDADPEKIDPIGKLGHRLPLGEIESLGLPYEGYQAAFTDTMLQKVFGERVDGIDLTTESGYHPHQDFAAAEGETEGLKEYHWIPSGRQGFNPKKFFQADYVQDPFGHGASTESDAYALLMVTAEDALPPPQTNVISAKNDYRVLQPFEVTDPNGNRSQVVYDAVGMVAGTAVMGKPPPAKVEGDSLEGFEADLTLAQIDAFYNIEDPHESAPGFLEDATTRIIYDLDRFMRSQQAHPKDPEQWLPVFAATMARETHVNDPLPPKGLKIQISFSYSDGFGREIQKKIQVEPGPVEGLGNHIDPRWVGTGTTIYNNRGKAVQQFEPFFSDHHLYGIEKHGVNPTLFYDPLERVVSTLHPNHTYEKVIFDPWRKTTWDGNDTVLLDPRNDPDVKDFVGDFFFQYDQEYEDEHGEPPQTWHQAYSTAEDNTKKDAARKTEAHAATPTVIHLDTLGRTFLTVAHNIFTPIGTGTERAPTDQFHQTRVVFDIEGNHRKVIDARDRIVMQYDYDMLSALMHQASMEAGQRWMLNDVAGQPIRAWDGRNHLFRTEYDPLRRPLRTFVTGADPAKPDQELLTERMVYGEQHPQAKTMNLCVKPYLHLDQAGVAVTENTISREIHCTRTDAWQGNTRRQSIGVR